MAAISRPPRRRRTSSGSLEMAGMRGQRRLHAPRPCAPGRHRRRPVPRPTKRLRRRRRARRRWPRRWWCCRCPSRRGRAGRMPPAIASMPKAMVATQAFSSIAGSAVMSPVGRSSARSNTLKPSVEGGADLVDRRAAGGEVLQHLLRHGLRIGRYAAARPRRDCAAKTQTSGRLTAGVRAALPGREPLGDLLQPPEAARRLGELRCRALRTASTALASASGIAGRRLRMSSKGKSGRGLRHGTARLQKRTSGRFSGRGLL